MTDEERMTQAVFHLDEAMRTMALVSWPVQDKLSEQLRANSIRYDALATYADAIERLVDESQNTQTSTDKTQPDTLQSPQA
jgi:hypothetical protein